MATSVEKLRALRPEVTAELEAMLAGSAVGRMAGPVLAFIRPQIDAKIDGWLSLPPETIDATLDNIIERLNDLRSDPPALT